MKRRILIVEDDERILFVIRKRLESAGYEVTPTWDDYEAWKLALAERPDVVVIANILVNLNGYQVCTISS